LAKRRLSVGYSFDIGVDVANLLDKVLSVPSPSPSPSPSPPSAPDRMRTHTPKIDGKLAADSAEKTEWEICFHPDPIVYLSCRIRGCNCQHYDLQAS
jgi:hypothetical protein